MRFLVLSLLLASVSAQYLECWGSANVTCTYYRAGAGVDKCIPEHEIGTHVMDPLQGPCVNVSLDVGPGLQIVVRPSERSFRSNEYGSACVEDGGLWSCLFDFGVCNTVGFDYVGYPISEGALYISCNQVDSSSTTTGTTGIPDASSTTTTGGDGNEGSSSAASALALAL